MMTKFCVMHGKATARGRQNVKNKKEGIRLEHGLLLAF